MKPKGENDNGNRSKRTHSETRKETTRWQRKENHKDSQQNKSRSQDNQVESGRSVGEDSRALQQRFERERNLRQARIDSSQNQKGKRKPIPLLPHGRLSHEARKRSGSGRQGDFNRQRGKEQTESQGTGEIKKRSGIPLRYSLSTEERAVRRKLLRIIQGIFYNKNGRLEL